MGNQRAIDAIKKEMAFLQKIAKDNEQFATSRHESNDSKIKFLQSANTYWFAYHRMEDLLWVFENPVLHTDGITCPYCQSTSIKIETLCDDFDGAWTCKECGQQSQKKS